MQLQMSDLRFRLYKPDGTTQSKPIHTEEWSRHEGRIRALHAANYKRSKALEMLRADCGCSQNCFLTPSYVKPLDLLHFAVFPSPTTTPEPDFGCVNVLILVARYAQYSAQLNKWGLRVYKLNQDPSSTRVENKASGDPLEGRTGTASVTTSGGTDVSSATNVRFASDDSSTMGHSDEMEKTANVQMDWEGREMQQGVEGRIMLDSPHCPKSLFNSLYDIPMHCSSCVAAPNPEYEPSGYALRLWSEILVRQDKVDAVNQLWDIVRCFCGAQSYADAFDICYILWTESRILPQDHQLAAALNCARCSATPAQDLCVDRVLHISLRSCAKGSLHESIVHSFLGELHESLDKTNAQNHLSQAKLHSGRYASHFDDSDHLDFFRSCELDAGFPTRHSIILALESQISRRETNAPKAIGYSTWDIPVKGIPEGFNTFVQEICQIALFEHLSVWCAKVICDNARAIDAFIPVSENNPGFARQLLLCYFLQRFLKDKHLWTARRSKSTRNVLNIFENSLIEVYPQEALSAMASLVTLDGEISTPTFLLNRIAQLRILKSRGQDFAFAYLPLVAATEPARKAPLDSASHMLVREFMRNIALTGLHGLWRVGNLVPAPELFQKYEIRPASLSVRLFSPRSSFSSGLNSMRDTAARRRLSSALGVSKRVSETSLNASPISSKRSSLSFSVVTGMPRAPSVLSRGESMDHEVGTIHEESQNEEMVDA